MVCYVNRGNLMIIQINAKKTHHKDIIMGTMESQITSRKIVYHLLRRSSKKTSKLHVTGLYEGNSPGDWWIPRTNGQ